MSLVDSSNSAGTICTAPSVKAKCTQNITSPATINPTQHLDHVIAFQSSLSPKDFVKTSSPNNSVSSVFERNRGYASYSVDWEKMYENSIDQTSSPDVSLSSTFNASTSWDSSVGGEPEVWSSRFMDRPSMDSFLNTTSVNTLLSNTDLFKKTFSLPNLRLECVDKLSPTIPSSPKVTTSNDSRGSVGERPSFETERQLEGPPSPIQFADDSKESDINIKEIDDDVDDQDLMKTYDIISKLEAQSPGSLDSKDIRAALKRFRRMPTMAKRILVLGRHKRSTNNA